MRILLSVQLLFPLPSFEFRHRSKMQVLPVENTHRILSCLAIPSIGNICPKTPFRKGTIPYTVRDSYRINSPLYIVTRKSNARIRIFYDLLLTIGNRQISHGLYHKEMRKYSRLKLLMKFSHHFVTVFHSNCNQDVTCCSLPFRLHFLQRKKCFQLLVEKHEP